MEKRTIILEEIDGELVLTVLKPGYNIIDYTIYDAPELAQQLAAKVQEYDDERQS